MMIARKFIVSGIVQGVGFRYFAQRSAARHQVTGYVKNLDDGSVETFVQGREKQVLDYRDDIVAGPRSSVVETIEETVLEPDKAFRLFVSSVDRRNGLILK
jgi:Acylphosphatases